MARFKQIQINSKEKDEHGFPKKYIIFHLGSAVRIGDSYTVPVLRVRDSDFRIAPLPNRMKATSEDEARAKAIDHFKNEAGKMSLECLVFDLPEM